MKIVSIVGTRPNFTKEYAINDVCRAKGIEEIIVHTGQHYDYEMSDIFFKELNLPRPKYINEIVKGSHGTETATMLVFLEEILEIENPDVTLVYGDVNSTLAGALASAKLRIPVAHIEAGLRSKAWHNPEEINRRVADTLSDALFPHIKEAYDSLLAEGFRKENVYLYGDIVKDALLKIMKKNKIKTKTGDYFLLTLHRAENTESPKRLKNILEAVMESRQHVKFPVHPRTKDKLVTYGLFAKLERNKNIEILPPQSYLNFIKLLAGCKKFLTDSGSARREAYILEKPVITLIDIVWVQEMVKCGWSRIAGDDKKKILDAMENHNPNGNRPEIFGDGSAAQKIVDTLIQRYA